MNQYKGAILTMILMVMVVVIPVLWLVETGIRHYTFLKVSTEFVELVKEEGGYSSRVQAAIDYYDNFGLDIVMKDSRGNTINSTVPAGETIDISYSYNFVGVRGEETYSTTSTALIQKR